MLKTEGNIHYMVHDQFVKGNILFADGSSLKTTDGNSVHPIVGVPKEAGYVEGMGSFAKFSYLSGIYQLNRTHVIVADIRNHCLRLVYRETNHTTPFLGTCGVNGSRDGLDPLFSSPWGITLLSEDPPVVIVTDRDNGALRAVNLLYKNVSTLPLTSPLHEPKFTVVDDDQRSLFVSSKEQLNRVNLDNYSVENVTGNGTSGDEDGWFDQATFKSLCGMVRLSKNVLIVADHHQSRLKVMDLEQRFVRSICPKDGVQDADGDIRVCKVDRPFSLLVVDDFLYIGGQNVLKRVKGKTGFINSCLSIM